VVVVGGRPATGGVRTWLLRGLFGALLAGCVLATILLLPPERIYAHAAQVTELATYPLMLVAAAFLYVYFRLTPNEGTAWLATAAVFGTAQGVGYAAMRVVLEDEIRANPGWLLLTEVVVAGLLVALLALSGAVRSSVDPLLLGLVLAAATTATRLGLIERMDPTPSLQGLSPVLTAALLTLYGALGLLLIRHVRLPAWAARRLALVVGLLGVAQSLTYPVPPDDWRSLVAVGLNVAGTTLLAVTSLDMVRAEVDRQDETERQVQTLEAHIQDDRTLLHEVAATVGGISAASRLLSIHMGLDPQERRRLEELLGAETARLDRMLAASHDELPGAVELDPLISSVLLAQGIRGRIVAWHPSGQTVQARADDLVEVLDLLLDNAALHSGSPTFEVVVSRHEHDVLVSVVDHGRGIPPEIAETVLEWGTHGSQSSGQGIGLCVARRLVVAMGGRLVVTSNDRDGTRVTLTLPAVADLAEVGVGHPSS